MTAAPGGEKEKRERIRELADLRVILNTEAGVRFFQRFFRDCYIFRPTHTVVHEGMRQTALKHLHDIREVAPELIAEMMVDESEI